MNNLTDSFQMGAVTLVLQPYVDCLVHWDNGIIDCWKEQTPANILWIFLPVIILFAAPILLPIFVYGESIFLHLYEFRKRRLQKIEGGGDSSSFFDEGRLKIAAFLDGVARFWNGYEVKGLENLPSEGPALLVSYHGTSPLELWYFMCRGMLVKRRMIHCVADQFCFKMPGWGKACKVLGITPGTIEDCITTLKEGKILIIAPGGVREALFANDETYQMMWENRCGYAKVIRETSVPVIPMFTENSREIFRTPKVGQSVFRMLYEKTRWPLCPLYGFFPVKLVTHLGEPMNFSPESSPEQIKHSVEKEVAKLIKQNQVLPGSILRGIAQRFNSLKIQDHKKEQY